MANWLCRLPLLSCLASLHLQGEEALHDPTMPLEGVPTTQGQQSARLPNLQAVLLGPDRHKALLDGQSYHVGDLVAGYQLHAIEASGVVLLRDGQQFRIPLYSSKVKVE